VMNHVRRALRQGAELVACDDRRRIDEALRALEQVREGSDRDLIRERTLELNRATERLAETLMDKALKDALASRRAEKILEQK
jgi:hypothetical protein